MDGKGDTFNIDRELDLRGTDINVAVSALKNVLSSTKEGNYVLVYINDYAMIGDIAKASLEDRATVENVLRKNENDWVIMIKNSVPVAQTG